MSSDDELMPRAFFVEDLTEPPPADPPISGEDYLKRVRWEASQCQQTVVSSINPRNYDKKQTRYFSLPPACPPAPPGLAPSSEWEELFLSDFSQLRSKTLHQRSRFDKTKIKGKRLNLPHTNDARAWYTLCFGQETPTNDTTTITTTTTTTTTTKSIVKGGSDSSDTEMGTAKNEGESAFSSNQDKTNNNINNDINNNNNNNNNNNDNNNNSILSFGATSNTPTFSSVAPPLLSVLFSLDQISTIKLITQHIQWMETRPLSSQRIHWLFSLLILLEKPLDPDVAASLRSLMRRLCVLRSRISSPSDPFVPPLNILITIISKFFGQHEG